MGYKTQKFEDAFKIPEMQMRNGKLTNCQTK